MTQGQIKYNHDTGQSKRAARNRYSSRVILLTILLALSSHLVIVTASSASRKTSNRNNSGKKSRNDILFSNHRGRELPVSTDNGQPLPFRQVRYFDFQISSELIPFYPPTEEPLGYGGAPIPRYLPVTKITDLNNDHHNNDDETEPNLMGPPIHVQPGDFLIVRVLNTLQNSGMSIHWHGFEMKNALAFDGVVGVTQCPIEPDGGEFTYAFVVEETPGTYWYHTHSGVMPGAYNAVRGPLIVHPLQEDDDTEENIVTVLNELYHGTKGEDLDSEDGLDDLDSDEDSRMTPLSYENERILFFSDGFTMNEADALWYVTGGLNAPISKNEDGFNIGTQSWDFGTVNGKFHENIFVSAGRSYKLRLINAGSVFALRISIPLIRMTVVGADSSSVKPMLVDEVILHTAERFDVEIFVPEKVADGTVFEIHAETLEARSQGYRNGIWASLQVTNANQTEDKVNGNVIFPHQFTKQEQISFEGEPTAKRVTLNCYSEYEMKDNSCLPITSLETNHHPIQDDTDIQDDTVAEQIHTLAEFHTVDFYFQPPPQFSHFVRIDGGLILQHTNPIRTSMLLPNFSFERDMHPHSAILNLRAYSTEVIVWRTETVMDHSIHVHGYKLEILEVALPNRKRDCTLTKCKLSMAFSSPDKLAQLESLPSTSSVLKDTFIIPAGGAVATRVVTRNPEIWFAQSHMDLHGEDGMAFILNVGNYTPPSDGSWLPFDYPDCDSKYVRSKREFPSCACYDDRDSTLDMRLTGEYRCSRSHLCHHELSQVASADLTHEFKGGVETFGELIWDSWIVLGVEFGCILVILVIIITCHKRRKLGVEEQTLTFGTNEDDGDETDIQSDSSLSSSISVTVIPVSSHSRLVCSPPCSLFYTEWQNYSPDCINLLRLAEVTGLALLTGFIFRKVGADNTNRGIRESMSLLFFSMTLWTFARMYPAVISYHSWRDRVLRDIQNSPSRCSGIGGYCLARTMVTFCAEGWWPVIYCAICFPLAQVAGGIVPFCEISLLLSLNTLCYLGIGSLLGVISPNVSTGMITSTIISQTSLVCAGFYTTLPPALASFRFFSPVYHTFIGLLKASYHWSDTFECRAGDSDAGATKCFLERSASIEDLKNRGIDVATFNDINSDVVWTQALFLVEYYCALQLLIFFIMVFLSRWREGKRRCKHEAKEYEFTPSCDDDDFEDGEGDDDHDDGEHLRELEMRRLT